MPSTLTVNPPAMTMDLLAALQTYAALQDRIKNMRAWLEMGSEVMPELVATERALAILTEAIYGPEFRETESELRYAWGDR